MKRIGMLTSGGDCQALNAAMRGVAKVIFCIVSDYSILFSAFTFFLNCFHLPFCNERKRIRKCALIRVSS